MSWIKQLFGGGVNMPELKDPTQGMDPSEMDPVLADLLASADRSGSNQWNETFAGIQDAYQRRGLGGSGIENENISEQGRQYTMDLDALKRSYALQLYQAWLQKRQQERDWAMNAWQSAYAIQSGKQAKNDAISNAVGQLAGNYIGGMGGGASKSTGGGIGSSVGQGMTNAGGMGGASSFGNSIGLGRSTVMDGGYTSNGFQPKKNYTLNGFAPTYR